MQRLDKPLSGVQLFVADSKASGTTAKRDTRHVPSPRVTYTVKRESLIQMQQKSNHTGQEKKERSKYSLNFGYIVLKTSTKLKTMSEIQ